MAESMRERVIRLYQNGRLSEEGLIASVKKGISTEADFYFLTNKTYDEVVNGKAGENNTETEENEDE